MKNKKILFNCVLTFLPIIILIISIALMSLLGTKNFNQTNLCLILVIVSIFCVIIGIVSTFMNIKLSNKVLKIIFLVISVMSVIIGIILVVSSINSYKTSKKYDKIINNYIERIKQETYSNLDRWAWYFNYKNGDLIPSNKYEILADELENNGMSCKWYVKIRNINKYKINVNIQCSAFSEDYSYFYKSKGFNNKLLENLD